MLRFPKADDKILQEGLFFNADYVTAWHHYVINAQLAKFQQIGEHHPFLRGESGALPVAFFDDFLKAFANGLRAVISAQDFRQTLQERLRLAVGCTFGATILGGASHLIPRP